MLSRPAGLGRRRGSRRRSGSVSRAFAPRVAASPTQRFLHELCCRSAHTSHRHGRGAVRLVFGPIQLQREREQAADPGPVAGPFGVAAVLPRQRQLHERSFRARPASAPFRYAKRLSCHGWAPASRERRRHARLRYQVECQLRRSSGAWGLAHDVVFPTTTQHGQLAERRDAKRQRLAKSLPAPRCRLRLRSDRRRSRSRFREHLSLPGRDHGAADFPSDGLRYVQLRRWHDVPSSDGTGLLLSDFQLQKIDAFDVGHLCGHPTPALNDNPSPRQRVPVHMPARRPPRITSIMNIHGDDRSYLHTVTASPARTVNLGSQVYDLVKLFRASRSIIT